MDWSGLVVPGVVILYGIAEYRRREKVHAGRLMMLARGEEPSFEPAPVPPLLLVSQGIAAVLLLGLSLYIGKLAIGSGKPFGSVGIASVVVGLYFALTVAWFAVTMRRYRRLGKRRGE